MSGLGPDVSRQIQARVSRGLAGSYEVERVVDSGGMALVFLARDLKHDRPVAIKVLRPDLAQGIGGDRFLKEIRIEASLDHANIVPVFDSGQAEGLPYYVMPFVDGESLEARLRREPQLPLDEAVRITKDVAAALSAAHEMGILHRDIKPANILLAKDRAEVADFGVARALDQAGATKFTSAGVAVGTPAYMSPEQGLAEAPLDPRADQYSLACVLYEMLAGEPPFSARSARALIYTHAARNPPRIRETRPEIPRMVERVLLKALSKSPADRFPTVCAFAEALEKAATPPTGAGNRAPSLGGTGNGFLSPRERFVDRVERGVLEHPVRLTAGVLAFGAVVIVASVLAARPFIIPGPPAWEGGRPESLVVLPFLNGGLSEEEEALASEVADRLARELEWWEPMRAVGEASLLGLMHDLGQQERAFESVGAAVEVARAAEAQALAGLTLRIRGDSAFAEVALYESQRGRLVRRTPPVQASVRGVEKLVEGLVLGVLELDPREAEIESLRAGTRDPDALAANWRGLDALYRADLEEAESCFRDAVSRDSTFSPALNNLALTLYWRSKVEARAYDPIYDEISGLSTRAMEHASELTEREAEHVRAFYAFQTGDFETARAAYLRLTAQSPTDLQAWLMAGTVEMEDPWLETGPDGAMVPRADWNRALESFESTVQLQPLFELGYLQLTDLVEDADDALMGRGCSAFWPPSGERVPPWDSPDPTIGPAAVCGAWGDGFEWIPRDDFDEMDKGPFEEGSLSVRRRTEALLERWAAAAPASPHPRRQLARALLTERRRRIPAPPDRSRDLALAALDHTKAAMGLQRDTTPRNLALQSNLHLAVGDYSEALRLARLALAAYAELEGRGEEVSTPQMLLVNPFLAVGLTEEALDIAGDYNGEHYIRAPGGDGLLALGGVEPIMARMRVMGVHGIVGPKIREEMARMEEIWDRLEYSEEERRAIRSSLTDEFLLLFIRDREFMEFWAERSDPNDQLWDLMNDPPVDVAERRRVMDDLIDSPRGVGRPGDISFVLGLLAAQWGDRDRSLRYLSRLDSIPFSPEGWDSGWGLLVESYRIRAESYESSGLADEAEEHWRLFEEARGIEGVRGG